MVSKSVWKWAPRTTGGLSFPASPLRVANSVYFYYILRFSGFSRSKRPPNIFDIRLIFIFKYFLIIILSRVQFIITYYKFLSWLLLEFVPALWHLPREPVAVAMIPLRNNDPVNNVSSIDTRYYVILN